MIAFVVILLTLVAIVEMAYLTSRKLRVDDLEDFSDGDVTSTFIRH